MTEKWVSKHKFRLIFSRAEPSESQDSDPRSLGPLNCSFINLGCLGSLNRFLMFFGDHPPSDRSPIALHSRTGPPHDIWQSSSGDVAGVGVSLSVDVARDLPLVVGIESGTPAAEAGLQVMKFDRFLSAYTMLSANAFAISEKLIWSGLLW